MTLTFRILLQVSEGVAWRSTYPMFFSSQLNFASTVARRHVLILFVTCCVFEWCKVSVVALDGCAKDICNQYCREDDCHKVCLGSAKKCNQFGYRRNSTFSCEASETCSQQCYDETCSLSCNNTKSCSQNCYRANCTTTCNAAVTNCTQAGYSENSQLICNSKKCDQVCHGDCAITCTDIVEKCSQVIYTKNSTFSCDASERCNQHSLGAGSLFCATPLKNVIRCLTVKTLRQYVKLDQTAAISNVTLKTAKRHAIQENVIKCATIKAAK